MNQLIGTAVTLYMESFARWQLFSVDVRAFFTRLSVKIKNGCQYSISYIFIVSENHK